MSEAYVINEDGQLEVTRTVVETYDSLDVLQSQLASFTAQEAEARLNKISTQAKIDAYNNLI